MQNKITKKDLEEFFEKAGEIKNIDELFGRDGLLANLVKGTVEGMLEAEMTNHLGYPKNKKILSPGGKNKRNGYSRKKLRTSSGDVQVEIPRDREGGFEPQIIPKHQANTSEFDNKIISMYAKGMTVSDINEHVADMYGVELSDTMISQITDKVFPQVSEWQNRTLDQVYPIVHLDAIHFKVREDGRVKSKAAYVIMGVNIEGKKDILGIWVGEEEGAKFWLAVLTDIQNRGVQDILIACCDNLKGFSEAIKTIFPKADIQKCIVHQIRNSLRYIVSKDSKEFLVDLKKVYKAATKDGAETNLLKLGEKWEKKYPLVIKSWNNNWDELSTYFDYAAEIRRIIYTTNPIESFNRQLRKVTKNKSVFPSNKAVEKMLFLVTRDVTKKWTMPVQNWATIISQLAIHFPDRLKLKI